MTGWRAASITIALWALLGSLGAPVTASEPIRIGASLAMTGIYAALGQNQHRGYELCVKHTNDKGGVLDRSVELVMYDDQSDPKTAIGLYEKLITVDKVDVVLGPYSSGITEAVANVNEKHKMPMVAPMAAATGIYKKGRQFIFMVQSPAEVYLEGFVDLVVTHGLSSIAFMNQDTLFPRATVEGAIKLAKRKGLRIVFRGTYARGTKDFSPILTKVRAANPDAIGAATFFDDAVGITRDLKRLNMNPKMYGVTVGADLAKFHEMLGQDAEFVYGASQWMPELVTLRAGGMIPIARQYPGAKEFTESYRKEYPGADFSYHAAGGYAGCQILIEAIRRAGSLDGEKIRDTILRMDLNTVYGGFRVDREGIQVSHRMVTFQRQDGEKVIVWPEELTARKPRFPTPPWSQR